MKPAEMKFLPHTTGTNKLTAMYETVKTHIEQTIHTEDVQTWTRYCGIPKGTKEERPIRNKAGKADVNIRKRR